MCKAKLRMPLLVALTLVAWPVVTPAQATGHWVKGTKFAPLSEPAEEYWSATANGKFYLFGGSPVRTGDKAVLPGRVIEYDPATDKFNSKKQMPRPSEHMTLAEAGGKIYLFGGLSTEHPGETTPGNFYLKDSWQYDPANDSWKAVAPMPEPRQAGAAVEVNGKIYVIGGRVGAAFISIASDISLVEIYNPATDTWEPPGARMPTARSAVASAVYNAKIYVAGGEWQDPVVQTAFRVFEVYDPATNTWSVLPPMATPRHGVAGAVIGNRFYAVSGDVQSSGTGVAVSTPAATAFEFSK